MRRLLSIIVSLVTAISFAQQPVELPLWPDGAPNSSGLTGEEQETRPHFVTNVTHPTLTVYHPEKPNGMAIIMCPGGGYRGLGMDGEGYDMAPWFCGQGITYMVLKYRMPNGHWEVPVSDAEQAIRMVRQHAKEWNVDPYKVGLMGASAGGHLTATLATHYNSETRPDFQILLYPVVTMMQVTRGNTRTALLGKNPTMEQIQKFSAELQVTPDTPQAFIALTSDDPSVAPYHGVNYYLALQKTRFRQLSMFILPEDMAGDLRIILNISNNGHRSWRNGCATALYSRKIPNPCYESGNLTWELNTWLTH